MKRKYLIYVVVIIIIAVILYFILKKKKQAALENEVPLPNVSGSNSSNSLGSVKLPFGTFPIMKGQTSELVKYLQKSLNILHNKGLVEDGIFGPKTEQALLESYKVKVVDKDTTGVKILNDLRSAKLSSPEMSQTIKNLGLYF
jgi:hypothetical protein